MVPSRVNFRSSRVSRVIFFLVFGVFSCDFFSRVFFCLLFWCFVFSLIIFLLLLERPSGRCRRLEGVSRNFRPPGRGVQTSATSPTPLPSAHADKSADLMKMPKSCARTDVAEVGLDPTQYPLISRTVWLLPPNPLEQTSNRLPQRLLC